MCIEISHIIMGSVCIKVALNFIFLNECIDIFVEVYKL